MRLPNASFNIEDPGPMDGVCAFCGKTRREHHHYAFPNTPQKLYAIVCWNASDLAAHPELAN